MHSNYISVIIPTHNHGWEIDKVMYSLERQTGISHEEYEIIIVNTNPNDSITRAVARFNQNLYGNVKYVEVFDTRKNFITNATYGGNIGARIFSKGRILVLVVDSARIPTPRVLRRTRDEFERWGDNLITTTTPYHIGKHYFDKSFTVEECRKLLDAIRWKVDAYHLFDLRAHTRISKTGKFNESTWLGVTRENFLKINGYNETFLSWGPYNIDLFRRLTRAKPKEGTQIVNATGQWGKIGLGLDLKVLDGEADFHIHHEITVPRKTATIRTDAEIAWKEYSSVGECIKANMNYPNWGTGDAREIDFLKEKN